MEKFLRVLENCKVSGPNVEFNFVSMRGGKYMVHESQMKKFLKCWVRSLPEQTYENSKSLTWLLPDREHFPITLDLDIVRKTEEDIDNQIFELLAEDLCRVFYTETKTKSFGCFLTRKPTTKIDTGWKTGVHMYVTGIELTREYAKNLYPKLLQVVDEFRIENDIINQSSDILDQHVLPFGKNGIRLCGEFKKGSSSKYHIFFKGLYTGENGTSYFLIDREHYTESEWLTSLNDNWMFLYGFLYKYNGLEIEVHKIGTQPLTPTRRIQAPEVDVENVGEFDLKTFLEKTGSHIPNQTEYPQLISYFARIKLDKVITNKLCNTFWNKKQKYPENETMRLMQRYNPNNKPVTQASIKRYFKLYTNDQSFDVGTLWKKNNIVYYNGFEKFIHGIHEQVEVVEFLKDMCSYVFSDQVFSWLQYFELRDKNGQIVKNVNRQISKKPPFTGLDDFNVACHPSRKEIMAEVNEKINELKEQDKKPTGLDDFNVACHRYGELIYLNYLR